MSHSLKIGDSNIIEAKSYVGRQTNLSNGCIVGAGCRLTTEETLAENCVVYGGSCDRRQAADRPAPQTLQIDFLSKVFIHYANEGDPMIYIQVLPNYHHLKKPDKKPVPAS